MADIDGQALARAVVYDIQHPDAPSIIDRVVDKIHGPAIIYSKCLFFGTLAAPKELLSAFATHGKTQVAIDPIHALVIDPRNLWRASMRERAGSRNVVAQLRWS